MTDFRALCAELLSALESEGYAHWVNGPDEDALCLRARAALAQPEPEGPTDEELESVARAAEIQNMKEQGGLTANDANGVAAQLQLQRLAGLRAVLARWSRPAPQPVPVSERLPGPEDCDAEGRCWWWDGEWGLVEHRFLDYCVTHWLPAHALPLPEVGND